MKRTLISTAAVMGLIGLGFGAVAVADGHKGKHKGMHAEKRAAMLEQYDANGDGKLDEAERDAVRLSRFAEIDVDGNGTLTKQEVTDHKIAKMTERIDAHFAKEDIDGDGVISAEEFGSTRKAKRGERKEKRKARRAEMLDKFDADGDGKLSEAERAAARDAGFGRGGPRKDRGSAE